MANYGFVYKEKITLSGDEFTKALTLARKIPSGSKTKAKCRAVHAWVKDVKEMLANG